jgi:hypothetical protein
MPSLEPNTPSPRVTDIWACGDSTVEPLMRLIQLRFRSESLRDRADDERVVHTILQRVHAALLTLQPFFRQGRH